MTSPVRSPKRLCIAATLLGACQTRELLFSPNVFSCSATPSPVPTMHTAARAVVRSGPSRQASTASAVRIATRSVPQIRRCRTAGFCAQERYAGAPITTADARIRRRRWVVASPSVNARAKSTTTAR